VCTTCVCFIIDTHFVCVLFLLHLLGRKHRCWEWFGCCSSNLELPLNVWQNSFLAMFTWTSEASRKSADYGRDETMVDSFTFFSTCWLDVRHRKIIARSTVSSLTVKQMPDWTPRIDARNQSFRAECKRDKSANTWHFIGPSCMSARKQLLDSWREGVSRV